MKPPVSKLLVVAVIPNQSPPGWVGEALKQINDHPLVDINSIIVQQATAEPTQQTGAIGRLARKVLYNIVDRSQPSNDVQAPVKLPDDLRDKISTDSEADQTAKKSEHPNIDLVLHFGDYKQGANTLPPSTHGVWTLGHRSLVADIEHALLTRAPLLWVHLWQFSNEQNQSNIGERLASHALPTQSFSISAMINYTFASLPAIMLSRINWLANGHDPLSYEHQQTGAIDRYQFPDQIDSHAISGVNYLYKAIRLLTQLVWQRIDNRRYMEQWHLGFATKQTHASNLALDNYQVLKPASNNIWWADPHVLVENGETHVFFEDMDIHEKVGKISTAVLTENGFASEPVVALDESHHLSYPYVFRHQNDIYMIPETAARRTVSLYKATQFPQQWTMIKNLFNDLDAADTTLFEYEGRWWMFTNGMTHPEVDERDLLWLYHTDDVLTGQWQPHPLNPVVTGVDRARMAGKVYTHEGELFRPSQYGAVRYGYGINLSKITTLSTTDYHEELVSHLCPESDDKWLGCHTAVHADDFTVIDQLRRVRR